MAFPPLPAPPPPAQAPEQKGIPQAGPSPLLCCEHSASHTASSDYQRVQLVLQFLVGPLGSCVAVLQPAEEYKADPWVKIPPSCGILSKSFSSQDFSFLIRINALQRLFQADV